MNNLQVEGFCVYVKYESSNRKLFLAVNKGFEGFMNKLRKKFESKQPDLKIFEAGSEAGITSLRVLGPNDSLFIKIDQSQLEIKPQHSVLSKFLLMILTTRNLKKTNSFWK